jgi:hypothetical protein
MEFEVIGGTSNKSSMKYRRNGRTHLKTESTTVVPEQRTKLDQQQSCRNNEQNRINKRHGGTSNRTGSRRDMQQEPTEPAQ